MPYRSLNPDLIIQTVETLSLNMARRFGGRGLTRVAEELVEFARQEAGLARELAQPLLVFRLLVYLVVVCAGTIVGVMGWSIKNDLMNGLGPQNLENFEALINLLILLAAGFWALLNLETHIKRHAVLVRINQLRSIAHVIDMHQLSKDPMGGMHLGDLRDSRSENDLQGYELARYLDYCADLLTITGKLAAIYLEYIEDPVVLTTINDFESLTGDMARKIWQKVTVLELQGNLDTPQTPLPTSDAVTAVADSDELPHILKE